jgi:hypothetical protein
METRSNHVIVGAVVLILLAVLAIFTVWIARLGGAKTHEYDIFFKQSVDGLATGSTVTYSGVPTGQVKKIALWKPDPQFVRVRVSLNEDTPILQGTRRSRAASPAPAPSHWMARARVRRRSSAPNGPIRRNAPMACRSFRPSRVASARS